MANVTLKAGMDRDNLQVLFSKMKNVFFIGQELTSDKLQANLEMDIEFPVLEGGVTFDTGAAEITEIKLTTGDNWVSRAIKGDSDISFQVASMAGPVNDMFFVKKGNKVTGIKFLGEDGTYSAESFSLEVKKLKGAIMCTDDSGDTIIILLNVEVYASFNAADGDNPAYFNVRVTPKNNSEGAAISFLTKEEEPAGTGI